MTALILETIVAGTVDHADSDLEASLLISSRNVGFFHGYVVTQLGDPLEARDVSNIEFHDLLSGIT